MLKNKIFKRVCAGLLAGACAFSMLANTFSGMIRASAEDTSTIEFPSSDEVVAQAAKLLGTRYTYGAKGGNPYTTPYKLKSVSEINAQGIDCSGLIWWTLTNLGYKTSGFGQNNPVPADSFGWLGTLGTKTITYGGVTAPIDIEKENLPTPADTNASKTYEYWECKDGSTIIPGSVVIAQNPNGEDHSWIYIGEFDSRDDVVAYLKEIGVSESLINSKTVGDGKGSGGKHWRIESNGSEGVVINNKTSGKTVSAMNMYAFRVTPHEVTFEIDKYTTNGKLVGSSPVDNSTAVYGIYKDADCSVEIAKITIGEDGRGFVKLPPATYYAKELSAPTGYALDDTVYPIKPGENSVIEEIAYGNIQINKTAEDGVIGDREFMVAWTENGEEKTKTAKTDDSGTAFFSNLRVYDLTNGKAIKYNVSEINVETRYVTPKEQDVVLTDGDKNYTVNVSFDNELIKGRISVQKIGDSFKSVRSAEMTVNGDPISFYTPHFSVSGLEGAVFEVKAVNDIITADGTVRVKAGEVVDTIITDKTGYAQTKPLYLGKYTVTEKSAPFGYVRNRKTETVELKSEGQTADVETSFVNDYQSVKIHLTKFMEHDETYDVGSKEDAVNVVFGLYADEQITAADGSFIPADGLISYVSVGEDMTATFEAKLPFGKYYVKEIATDDKYVISDKRYTVELKYAGQDTKTVEIDCGKFENNLKRGSVYGIKVDKHDKPLANAVFGLFKADCKVFDADHSIATAVSDENGYFSFKAIPYGKYIVTEIEAPTGYVFSDKKYDVVIDDDKDKVEIKAENSDTELHVSKQDIYGEELEGAVIQIIDADGNIFEEWVSEKTIHTVTNIPAGSYTLHEAAAPEGFVISTDISFDINRNNVVTVNGVQAEAFDENGVPTIVMIDDTTKVKISKKDITNENELPGAKLIVIDEEGRTIEEWISSTEPHYIEGKLIAGKTYTLREITAPDGYEIAIDVQFTVNEDGTVTEVVMYDEHTPETPPSTPPKTGADADDRTLKTLLAVSALCLAVMMVAALRIKGKKR